MADLRLQEANQLDYALKDPETAIALRKFFQVQARHTAEKIRDEVRKSPIDALKLAHHGGTLDAYETAFNELKHFVESQLREAAL